MENERVFDIDLNLIYAAIIIVIAAVVGYGVFLKISPYVIVLGILLGVIALVGTFVYCQKHCLSEMHCMMCGMVFGMMPALVVSTIHALQSGDFVMPIISGTVAGALIGIPFGSAAGTLGRMEAVMAAPMASVMGSMAGIMVRIYDVDVFMVAFAAIVLFVMGETALMVHKTSGRKMNFKNIGTSCMLAIAFMLPITMLSYPTGASAQNLQELLQSGGTEAAIKGRMQELTLKITPYGYEPNVLTVKAGIPVKLNLQADPRAGCGRAIIIPDFGIRKIVQPGSSDFVEFTPTKKGQHQFSCSMGMMRGVINVR